jgi:hypothetical protein
VSLRAGVALVRESRLLYSSRASGALSNPETGTADGGRAMFYSCRSSFISHMSTEARVPGVSAGSIAAKT